MNLASSFVNGFVNAAFGQDKLLTDDGNKWLYKNKDHGEGWRCLWAWGCDPFWALLKVRRLGTALLCPQPAGRSL